MLDAISGAEHTIDFLTFVYWNGRDRDRVRACGSRARARAGVRVRLLLDAWGAHPMERAAHRRHGSSRRARPLVPSAAPVAPRRVQPPHAPQGDGRRRIDRVHRRRRDRGRVEGRRSQRERVARHALPHPGARRSTGLRAAFLDNWAETDPVLFDDEIDRFPDQPKPGDSVVQCVRGASETGWSDVATLFRTLLQSARDLRPHRDRVLRPGRGAHQAAVRRRRPRRPGADPAARARTPTSASCSSPARRTIRGAPRPRRRAVELPAVDAARQGHDGRRRRREHRVRQPQRPFDRVRRGDQRRRDRSRRSCRCSTTSSTRISSAACGSRRYAGGGGRCPSASASRLVTTPPPLVLRNYCSSP